jgi:cytochrome c biogenesis protein CcmG, thiol:disulfide interchange protein DsbE
MNLIYRYLIILLPLLVFIFYAKILMTDQIDGAIYFQPKELPQFELLDLENREIEIAAFNGFSLLNVWASWCITCLVEHPFLTQLSNNEIKLIGLNYKDSQNNAMEWLGKRGNPYAFSIYDPRGDLAFDLGVTGAPETFLIFNQQIIGHIQGELNQEKWQSIFMPLIQAAKETS